jgi:hypothetical protein
MNKKQLLGLVTGIATLATCAYAQDATETFRTLAAGTGIYQNENAASKPAYGIEEIFGHDLVAAVLGAPLGTVVTNPVLALQVDCGSTTASLVAFDKLSSNVVATIAVCTNLSVVKAQDVDTTPFPNKERFVGQFVVNTANNLQGGFLTIAGRLQLDPTNGCPRAIRVQVDPLDRSLDHLFRDSDGKNADDPKNDDILRAGVAHAVGAVNLIFNSSTNQVLLPFVAMSIRHQLN